jgi:hypothetical protein
MHDVLGFERYGAHGSDLGAGECSLLAYEEPGLLSDDISAFFQELA